MFRARVTVVLTLLLLAGLFVTTVPARWQRVQRVSMYDAEKRALYPSLARDGKGSLLVTFTRQTAEQEVSGVGDLLLVRSEDRGQTWFDAEVIYVSRKSQLRAVGMKTRLKNGKVILPVVLIGNQQTTCRFG